MSPNVPRAVGYVRVSTEAQAADGVSLDAQRAKLEAFALAMDMDLIRIETDSGRSAKTLDRPGLQAALAALDTGQADTLLIPKLDRLTRSVTDLGTLIARYFESRCALVSVADSINTTTAAGRLVLNVLVSVSQWEREAIGERTADALAHLRAQGVQLGGEALGWRRTRERDADGRQVVVECPQERATVARIIELRQAGCTLRGIAAQLAAEHHPTKRGGRWHASTVGQVLRREQRPPLPVGGK